MRPLAELGTLRRVTTETSPTHVSLPKQRSFRLRGHRVVAIAAGERLAFVARARPVQPGAAGVTSQARRIHHLDRMPRASREAHDPRRIAGIHEVCGPGPVTGLARETFPRRARRIQECPRVDRRLPVLRLDAMAASADFDAEESGVIGRPRHRRSRRGAGFGPVLLPAAAREREREQRNDRRSPPPPAGSMKLCQAARRRRNAARANAPKPSAGSSAGSGTASRLSISSWPKTVSPM